MTGTYNLPLVALSLCVAVLAAYTALDMAGRIAANEGWRSRWWLLGGSFAMGVGIWSMHFLGMLAFRMPMQVSYDPTLTAVSLAAAICSSAFALWLVSRGRLHWAKLSLGAILMGAGVAGMHYMGMAAMQVPGRIHYAPLLFLTSVLIAVAASGAALWLVSRVQRGSPRVTAFKTGAALLMGVAIAGMHYTGMAAVRIDPSTGRMVASSGVSENWLAILLMVGTVCVLGIALLTSSFDVRLATRTARLADSLAFANRELTYLAMHDPLTKLANRACLQRQIEQALSVPQVQLAALFLDLDGFKGLNDAFGHDAGDDILVQMAERIQSCAGSEDFLARLGGDEFVILCRGVKAGELRKLAVRVIEQVKQGLEVCGQTVHLSVSIGIAQCEGGAATCRDLLTYADMAMYQAKAEGGGSYRFFEEGMRDRVLEQLGLTQDMRGAAERGEFLLLYQPKFRAGTLELLGVEALIRWQHPVRGVIGPDKFIPLAEKTGLILSIGHWTINEACRQLAAWRDARANDVQSVAVNLSTLQLLDPNLVETVRSAIATFRLRPQQLVLEITESTAMRNVEASTRILQQLHNVGVRISIDDFGTGYSSLLHLKRLPATELKIDRGFVRDLQRGSEDQAIISAIIALSRSLHLTVVAEGVETLEQREYLTRVGCDELQGYLLGRPVPAHELEFRKPAADAIGEGPKWLAVQGSQAQSISALR